MKNYRESVIDKKTNIILLIIILSMAILTGGYFYYRNEEATIRDETCENLKAIALLKESQLFQWRKERTGDAYVISHSSYFIKEVDSWLDRKIQNSSDEIIEFFQNVKQQYGYKDIFLTSPQGEILLSTDIEMKVLDSSTSFKMTWKSMPNDRRSCCRRGDFDDRM